MPFIDMLPGLKWTSKSKRADVVEAAPDRPSLRLQVRDPRDAIAAGVHLHDTPQQRTERRERLVLHQNKRFQRYVAVGRGSPSRFLL